MRKLAFLSLVAVGCVGAATAANLIANPDLSEDDGLGRIVGWETNLRQKKITTLDAKPIGDGAFSVHAKGVSWAIWQQTKIGLVSNAQYRLSYDVRTTGLGGVKPQFYICDSKWSWKRDQNGDVFPDDTKGEWVRQEKVLRSLDGGGKQGHILALTCLSDRQNPADVRFEIRNLKLEAVDPAVAAQSTPRECARKLKARIVPVDPLLTAVDPVTGKMSFYWPGSVPGGRASCTLAAKVDGGKEVSAALGADGYASLAFGKLKVGQHALALEVRGPDGRRLAADGYELVAKRPVPEKTAGRKLNNLVTELVNRPLEDGTVEFSRPKAGWTWISFGEVGDDDGSLRGYLDDWGHPVVCRREGEPYLETQRWLPEGVHTLRIVGSKPGRTLKIHAVKTIWGTAPYDLSTRPFSVVGNFNYTLPFAQRFALVSTFNTLSKVNKYLDGSDDTGAGFYYERGISLMGGDKLVPEDPDRLDFEANLRHLKSGSWRLGRTVNVDENLLAPESLVAVNFSESVWTLFKEDPSHRVNVWYADTATGNYYRNPEINVSEIAAIVNTGNGTGLLMPECYAPVGTTHASLQEYLDGYANFVLSAERMVPAAKGATILYGAGYIDIFDWSNYYCPATDVKVHYSEMVRAFATDPRFAGCAGIAFGGGMCCEEEFRRWGAKVTRHYALEGATDDLAGSFGYVWTPGFVRDPDFENGFTNWTVRAAEAGALVPTAIRGYGTKYQNRIGAPQGCGDTAALFRASAKGASEVSQKLTGLVPGRYYALHFSVADKKTMTPRRAKPPRTEKRFFSARLEGAEEVKDLTYEHLRRGQRNFRYVFRATAPEATLVLTDTAKGLLNEPGVELLVNYVLFRPYYVENEREIAEVISALGWADRANR